MNIFLTILIILGIYYLYTIFVKPTTYQQAGSGCGRYNPETLDQVINDTSIIDENNNNNENNENDISVKINTCGQNKPCGITKPKNCGCESSELYTFRTMFPEVRQESYTGCYNSPKCDQDLLKYIDLTEVNNNNKIETEYKPINLQINNHIPNHLISKIQLSEVREFEIEPANNNIAESPAYFQSQFTNLASYFKMNPELFDPNKDRRNQIDPPSVPYVPYTTEWQGASDCFNNVLYDSVKKNPPVAFISSKVQ